MSEQIIVTEAWLNLVRSFPANATSSAVLALLDEIERLKQELKCEHIDSSAVCQDLRNVIVEYQENAQRADAANYEHFKRLHDQISIRDQKIESLEEELVGLRRFERRWHKLLSESEPSPEFLSGEAFRLKEQS